MPSISVIIPVYNVEETLERCVGSVISQTHKDLDIILVDDGSTDISGAMCDAYAEYEPRIRVFHTPNRGLSAARNLGTENAITSGAEYITYVDSDDYLELDMLEKLLKALEASDADIATCGYFFDGLQTTNQVIPFEAEYDGKQALTALINGSLYTGAWAKLYSKQTFEELHFPEGRVFEDLAIMHRVFLSCDKIVAAPFAGYHYVMRKGSIIHATDMKSLADHWKSSKDRYDYVLDKAPDILNEETRNKLAKNTATAISKTWRWAHGNNPDKRAEYANVLQEMAIFARKDLESVDKSRWPLTLQIPIAFAKHNTTASLAVVYHINQIFIRLFPKRASSKK